MLVHSGQHSHYHIMRTNWWVRDHNTPKQLKIQQLLREIIGEIRVVVHVYPVKIISAELEAQLNRTRWQTTHFPRVYAHRLGNI